MQMSYMSLNDFKNLNRVERRSSKFKYINPNKKEKDTPESLIDIWKKRDLEKYKTTLKEKYKTDKELNEKLKEVQLSDYAFVMNWNEEEVDTQSPDIKPYPTEGISAKYYVNEKEKEETTTDSTLDTKLDKDVIKNLNNIKFITKGEWVDTREETDTTQSNKYTSEDFYFENFNLNRTGYEYDNGLKGYIGLEINGSSGNVANGVSSSGSEVRSKIVEYAEKIHQMHTEGKAQYYSSNQTYDPDELHYYNGTLGGCTNPVVFDCSSFSSTCYKYAGLTSLYKKSCSGGAIMKEITNNGGEMWLADNDGIAKALPGDCIVRTTGAIPTQADMESKKNFSIEHIMVYIGNGQIIHASTTKEPPNGIPKADFTTKKNRNRCFFIRPKDLIEADKISSSTNNGGAGSGCFEESGTIDGNKYIYKLGQAKLTGYGSSSSSTDKYIVGKTCASHNLPVGTKVYIPATKGKGYSKNNGIWTVTDTGSHCFDFDLLVAGSESTVNSSGFNNLRGDVYVLSWGNGSITWSYTEAIEHYNKQGDYNGHPGAYKYHSAWKDYMSNGGVLINLWKFKTDDQNIKNKSWYNKI